MSLSQASVYLQMYKEQERLISHDESAMTLALIPQWVDMHCSVVAYLRSSASQ